MCKKLTSLLLTFMILFSMVSITTMAADSVNAPRQLKTLGNQFVYADDPTIAVRLTGVTVPGAEWTGSPQVEKIQRSVIHSIDNWNCNLIRLPVSVNGWTGNYSYVVDGGKAYRTYIDDIINIAYEKGVYVLLELYAFNSFNKEDYLTFWVEAATKYANNPAVLFGLMEYPTGNSWDIWRDGNDDNIRGHQQVVEMIRDLGAKNILVASGLGYGANLTGIPDGYALVDQGSDNDESKAGYGIAYSGRILNSDGDSSVWWDKKIGAARMEYPVIIGECGWDNSPDFSIHPLGSPEGSEVLTYDKWVTSLLEWFDDDKTYGTKVSYAAYCMHPTSVPSLIVKTDNWGSDDYAYEPTPYWGVYVKEHLAKCADARYTKVTINYGNLDDDEDASIDTADLHLFKLHLKGKKPIKNHHRPAADLDGDGYVDASDMQELKLYISKGKPFSVKRK